MSINERIAQLEAEIANLKAEQEKIEQREYFEHTHVYFRPDRNAWIARWNSPVYKLRHIRQFGPSESDRQEALATAQLYSEIASFVIESHSDSNVTYLRE